MILGSLRESRTPLLHSNHSRVSATESNVTRVFPTLRTQELAGATASLLFGWQCTERRASATRKSPSPAMATTAPVELTRIMSTASRNVSTRTRIDHWAWWLANLSNNSWKRTGSPVEPDTKTFTTVHPFFYTSHAINAKVSLQCYPRIISSPTITIPLFSIMFHLWAFFGCYVFGRVHTRETRLRIWSR